LRLSDSSVRETSAVEEEIPLVTKRVRFSYTAFLDRILNDASAGNFPIQCRKRSCERILDPVRELNEAWKTGVPEVLSAVEAKIAIALVMSEDLKSGL